MADTDNPVRDSLLSLGIEAERMGLPHMLVGGNALLFHGVARFTRDIDFLIPESAVAAWRALLESRGLHCIHATDAFAQFEGQAAGSVPVDLMLVDASTWEKLKAAGRKETLAAGYAPLLPSPLHLIAMKLQASRSPARRHRQQDWSDVLELVRLWTTPGRDEQAVKQIFERYGGPEDWDRLRRDLPPPP